MNEDLFRCMFQLKQKLETSWLVYKIGVLLVILTIYLLILDTMVIWILLIGVAVSFKGSSCDLCEFCKIKNGSDSKQLICSNVTVLFFANSNISTQNVQSLVCINCNLDIVAKDTFQISTNYITSISIIKSNVKSIKELAFTNFTPLRTLKLNDNNIAFLSTKSLKNLTKLAHLDLSRNSLKRLPEYLFLDLHNLDLLNLNYNEIMHITLNTFEGLLNLKYLYLNNNLLTIIESKCFQHLHSLKILYLENNNIREIYSDAFYNVHNLEYLYINNNSIEHLKPYNFKPLSRLVNLQLRNNSLIEINESSFNGLRNLKFLHLGRNNLDAIKPYGFIGLDSLKVLDLMENNFTAYNFDNIVNMKNLTTVWFNGNQLNQFIINYKADSLDELRVLGFTINNFSALNYKLLYSKMPKIAYIFIYNNPWKCEFLVNMYNYFKLNSVGVCSNDNCTNEATEAYVEKICNSVVNITNNMDYNADFTTDRCAPKKFNWLLTTFFIVFLYITFNM